MALVAASVLNGVAPAQAAAKAIAGCGLTATWTSTDQANFTGTFPDSSTVSVVSQASGDNSGGSIDATWGSLAQSDNVFTQGFSADTSVAILGSTTGVTQTLTFSQATTNPVILIAYAQGDGSVDFGSTPVKLLDSSPAATVSGNIISLSAASGNTVDTGFAAVAVGTFGPTAPLVLTYYDSNPAYTPPTEGTGSLGIALTNPVDCTAPSSSPCVGMNTTTGTDGFEYVLFPSGSNCSWSQPAGTQFDYLVVGGGGGGGRRHAGGGGAGGMLWGSGVIGADGVFVTVGAGGAGAPYATGYEVGNLKGAGSPGASSALTFTSLCSPFRTTTVTAAGGGRGTNSALEDVDGSGGSAGATTGASRGTAMPLQGSTSGLPYFAHPNYAAGGGGGSGTSGSNASAASGGAGGAGEAWLPQVFSPTTAAWLSLPASLVGDDDNVYFAGGGGGGADVAGSFSNMPGGLGGIGGGGAGGSGSAAAVPADADGVDGLANTGGGGGGGGLVDNAGVYSAASSGGDGGSGVVIIRYKSGDTRTPVCVRPDDQEVGSGTSVGSVSYDLTYTDTTGSAATVTLPIALAIECTSAYASSDSVGTTHTEWCTAGYDSAYLFDTSQVGVLTVTDTPSGSTVTFYANNGSGSSSTQLASSNTALTANSFTNGTCDFAGWNTYQDGTGTPYDDEATYDFSADLDLYAQWNCGVMAITTTSSTCAAVSAGTAATISSMYATVSRKGTRWYVSGVNTGAVYAWVQIAPKASSGQIFTQSADPSFGLLTPMGVNYVYDSNCRAVKAARVSVASDGSSASISGVTSGQTYYVAVKLGTGQFSGRSVPASWPVTWTYTGRMGAKDTLVRLYKK